MERERKSKMIKKKKKIVSLICNWLGGWKSEMIEFFFFFFFHLVEMKNERIVNRVCINLPSYLY